MISQDDIDAMTPREVNWLAMADKVVSRAEGGKRPTFRLFHGADEEWAMLYAARFWRDQCAALMADIQEAQRRSMLMDGEE